MLRSLLTKVEGVDGAIWSLPKVKVDLATMEVCMTDCDETKGLGTE